MQSAMDFHGLGAKYPGSGGGLDEAAQAAGYRALGNGNYINQSRWWEAPISGQDLQGKLSSQTLAKQQSNPSNLIGSTDYLAQIQQYLNPQASSAAGGAASGTQTSNPYEQRLQQLVNDPNSISDSNAYKFRFNQGSRRWSGAQRPRACSAAATRWRRWRSTGRAWLPTNTGTRSVAWARYPGRGTSTTLV